MSTLAEIEKARINLKGIIRETPLVLSKTLSERTGGKVMLMLELFQYTGSFKIRGAFNAMLQSEAANGGVITASAGNHGLGVARAAQLLGIRATIIVPKRASTIKVERIKGYGAEVKPYGDTYDEAEKEALRIQKKDGLTFIHAFNDPYVIAGQGTIGLEIVDQWPEVDVIIAGVGGGGLISGVATAVKSKNPSIEVFGVEPTGAAKVRKSLDAGKLVTLDGVDTIADGLAARKAGDLTYKIIKKLVNGVVTVDDNHIKTAIRFFKDTFGLIAEGAGAIPIAALLAEKIDIRNKRAALIISGGNIDPELLSEILRVN